MFKTFPEFSSITLDDRQQYEAAVKRLPPISDLSFTTLMIWWNFDDSLKIAELNGNLVIYYYLPGDEQNSGLALVGTKNVDESMKVIFEELKKQGKDVRLVHVPEVVVKSLDNPSHFVITEERDYDEYIVLPSTLYPTEGLDHNTRRKIKKFVASAGEDNIEVRSLDLSRQENRDFLMRSAADWKKAYGAPNDEEGVELSILPVSIGQAVELGMQNLCLYVNGELQGFAVFQISFDKQYAIVNHIKVKTGLPRVFDYATFMVFKWVTEQGIPYLNLEMDLGIPGLRQHKMELKPIDFFRKYEVRPLSD